MERCPVCGGIEVSVKFYAYSAGTIEDGVAVADDTCFSFEELRVDNVICRFCGEPLSVSVKSRW